MEIPGFSFEVFGEKGTLQKPGICLHSSDRNSQ